MRRVKRAIPNWRLKTRIFGGFFAIGLAGFAIVVFLGATIENIHSDFQELVSISHRAEVGGEISSQMIELQRLSGEYAQSGGAFAAEQTRLVLERVQVLLDELRQEASPAVRVRAARMHKHLAGFRRAFVEVKRQRRKQSRLESDIIGARATQYEALAAEYEAGIPPSRPELLALLERLRNAALRIDKHTQDYFDSLDNARIRQITQEVHESRELLREMARVDGDGRGSGLIRRMEESLTDYRDAILKAVQLTRGYLHLVNVVMAAETYEVLYQSDRLSEDLTDHVARIEAEMTDTIQDSIAIAAAGVVLTLLLMGVMSYRLGRSVAAPIETLTEAFRRLARGETAADIDLSAASYEFRELSHAADVFRKKNEETEGLLRRYRELSEALDQRVTERTRELEQANRQLEKLSRTDGLTGLANRRCFEEILAQDWAVAVRQELCLAVIMLDVDFFKAFNDRYGHVAGDDCLRRVARILESVLHRKSDLAARYGGEEFVLVLQDTDLDGALRIAESVRVAVEGLAMPNADSPRGVVTVSIGVAVRGPEHDLTGADQLVKRADEALYRAKRGGRNQVRTYA